MKTVLQTIILLFSFSISYAQYIETFSTPNKGIFSGPCGATSTSCASFDFIGVDWDINGNFAGMDSGNGTAGSEDYISTNATGVFEFGGDIDEELCYESPLIDISDVSGAASFSVDVVWNGHDASDYTDVEYSIDGASWQQIPNAYGGGSHTIDYTSSGNSGSGTITQTNIFGSTLSIRVCVDTNTSAEGTTIDNVSVPETGAKLFVLPIAWGDIKLEKTFRGHQISWNTESETNNDYFEIERSMDGEIFEVIGMVDGAGNSSIRNEYNYVDENVIEGEYYYRLKQVDLDGQYDFSKTYSIVNRSANNNTKIFPNPFHEKLTLKLANTTTPSPIFIYNIYGSLIDMHSYSEGLEHIDIDTQDYNPGVYMVIHGTDKYKLVKN